MEKLATEAQFGQRVNQRAGAKFKARDLHIWPIPSGRSGWWRVAFSKYKVARTLTGRRGTFARGIAVPVACELPLRTIANANRLWVRFSSYRCRRGCGGSMVDRELDPLVAAVLTGMAVAAGKTLATGERKLLER